MDALIRLFLRLSQSSDSEWKNIFYVFYCCSCSFMFCSEIFLSTFVLTFFWVFVAFGWGLDSTLAVSQRDYSKWNGYEFVEPLFLLTESGKQLFNISMCYPITTLMCSDVIAKLRSPNCYPVLKINVFCCCQCCQLLFFCVRLRVTMQVLSPLSLCPALSFGYSRSPHGEC